MANPEFLVNADPEEVRGLLGAVSGPAGSLAGAVYRASADLHRDVGAGVRRQLLALDAARHGDRELSARITAVPVDGGADAWWGVEWATGSMVDHGLRQALPGHTDTVPAVATVELDGCPVAVSGSYDGTVRVWDLATGHPVGEPLICHTNGVLAVATAVVDGRPVLVTGSRLDEEGHGDGMARVWDLATGHPVGEPLSGHIDAVDAIATAVLDGRPVAVTGSWDGTVRVWDLMTGRPVGKPLSGHAGPVLAVATGVVDGRPVAVSGSWDGTVRVWDLATGRPVGEPLTGHTDWVWAVATGVVDGRPVAVSGSDDMRVRVWDLATGEPVGPELVFPSCANAVAVAPDGRLVVAFDHEVAVLARR